MIPDAACLPVRSPDPVASPGLAAGLRRWRLAAVRVSANEITSSPFACLSAVIEAALCILFGCSQSIKQTAPSPLCYRAGLACHLSCLGEVAVGLSFSYQAKEIFPLPPSRSPRCSTPHFSSTSSLCLVVRRNPFVPGRSSPLYPESGLTGQSPAALGRTRLNQAREALSSGRLNLLQPSSPTNLLHPIRRRV